MSEPKLRVGIIGIGWQSANQHVPNLRATGRAEVVAASRRNAERLALVQRELAIPATYTDWREMLAHETLDAVVISTPHNQHVEPTLAALERGLHVLLEKPLATTVADAQTILRAAHRSDRVVMMAVGHRGTARWRITKDLLASGQIGRVRQLSVTEFFDWRDALPLSQSLQQSLESDSEINQMLVRDILGPDAWRRDPLQMGGDELADSGANLIDAMLWMAGAPPVEVAAFAPKDRPQQAAIFTLQALLSNEAILSLTFNNHVAMGDDFDFRGAGRLAISGDKGMLTAINPGMGGALDEMVIERNGARQAVSLEGENVYPAEAFVRAIRDGAPNFATVDAAALVVALTQGAYQSAAERRIVRLNESN